MQITDCPGFYPLNLDSKNLQRTLQGLLMSLMSLAIHPHTYQKQESRERHGHR